MIVGANPVTVRTAIPERAAPARAPMEAAVPSTASDALTQLDDFVESAALSRKAFAEERLNHLKEQMNSLMLFNLAPGFLAGHTARMARELEAAATDFASSFKTLAGLGQTPKETQAEAPTKGALPPAYLDILADDAPGNARLNEKDMATAESFMNTAYQLRGVVEMMADESDDKAHLGWSADGARESTSRVTAIMARLEGPSAFNRITW